MRLTELDPRWLTRDGVRVGFIFRSPTRQDRWQSCFEAAPPRREQWAMFRAELGDGENGDIQGCTEGCHWTVAGGMETADFATLTVTPSLDGSRGGNWHGFITAGEIVGGL